jgi:hypothetical protein
MDGFEPPTTRLEGESLFAVSILKLKILPDYRMRDCRIVTVALIFNRPFTHALVF